LRRTLLLLNFLLGVWSLIVYVWCEQLSFVDWLMVAPIGMLLLFGWLGVITRNSGFLSALLPWFVFFGLFKFFVSFPQIGESVYQAGFAPNIILINIILILDAAYAVGVIFRGLHIITLVAGIIIGGVLLFGYAKIRTNWMTGHPDLKQYVYSENLIPKER